MDRQETAAVPCAALYELADEILKLPNVISNSVMLGFPFADVREMGSSFVVVCDGDKNLAKQDANRLAKWLYEHRQDYACQSPTIEQAIQEAQNGCTPTCLLDMGDNVGGGGPADGTFLLHALESANCQKSLVCLSDPQAVQQAVAAGVGAQLSLSMGGKTDGLHGQPFVKDVTVANLHDGRFTEPNVRHGGRTGYDMGPTAVVSTDSGMTVILTTNRVPPFSLGQVTSCGIDPADYDYIVAKGVNAPIAAYREVCKRFIRVDTPGVTSANMLRLKLLNAVSRCSLLKTQLT
jgi:microcystin degradation protein MlrC